MAKRRTALVVARPRTRTRTVVKYRTRTVKAPRRRRARSAGAFGGNERVLGLVAGAAAVGYLKEKSASFAAIEEKLPTLGNKKISLGVAAYFVNKKLVRNKYLGWAALGLLAAGAYDLGASGFAVEGDGVAGVGWDDAVDVSGELDDDEIEG